MPRNRKPLTARRAVRKGLVNAATVTAGLALSFVFLTPPVKTAQPVMTDPAPTAASLVAENDCWTGEGPEGVIPGHVVITMDGQPTLGGSRMTGKALAQLFDGADHGLTVHAFCR